MSDDLTAHDANTTPRYRALTIFVDRDNTANTWMDAEDFAEWEAEALLRYHRSELLSAMAAEIVFTADEEDDE